MQGIEYNLRTIHFVSYTNVSIFFYNTYVFLRFVIELSNKTSGCDALIYDGPSSRSPLLTGQINNQSKLQYKSKLSCILVYFKHVTALSADPQCINIYVEKASMPTQTILVASNDTVRLSFETHISNTYPLYTKVPCELGVTYVWKMHKLAPTRE